MIALAVDRLFPTELLFPVGAVRNVGNRALFADARADAVGVIAFVGDDDGAPLKSDQQCFGANGVVVVARRNQETDRAAFRVDTCVDLRGEAASASAHTTISTLFLGPEAC